MSEFELKIEVAEDAKQLIGSMDNRDGHYDRALAHALDLQNELTIGYAQANRLSGPRPDVLGVKSGLLRRSLRRTDAVISGDDIDGAIGENVAYAAVHEFGFDGDVEVQPFVRRTRSRDVLASRKGKPKLVAQGISFVRGFTRHMHVPERSFIRSSISDRLEFYNDALSQAVLHALGGATA